ncbi:MAG: hypothetical protein AB7G11_17830 [Phycisphaerales bacterium]
MRTDDFTYITVLEWPGGQSMDDLAEGVATATGLDRFTARQRVTGGVPTVIHRVESGREEAVLHALRARGIGATGVPSRAIREVAEPVQLKRVMPALGAPEPMFLFEPWREEARGVRAREVFLLVRAMLRTRIRGEVQVDVYPEPMVGPGGGIYTRYRTERYRHDRHEQTHVIDVYLLDGTAYRVSGAKFNFESLGEARGLTDRENVDKLACFMAESAAGCVVDMGFSEFRCPPVFCRGWRGRAKANEVRSDEGVFDFYSAWRYVVTRRELERGKVE